MRDKKNRRGLLALGSVVTALAVGATAWGSTLGDVTAAGHAQTIDPQTEATVFSATAAPWGNRLLVQDPASCAPADVNAVVACHLQATTGTLTLPSGARTIWGYAASTAAVGSAGHPGGATVPGPTLVATQGQRLRVTLDNNLPSWVTGMAKPATTFSIPGLATPTVSGSSTGTATYEFALDRPGTFVFGPGADTPTGNRQVSLGMGGVLVVRPAVSTAPDAPQCPTSIAGCAYLTPELGPTDHFSDEALVAVSDLSASLLDVMTADGNPLAADLVDDAPGVHLVNGKAFPQTDVISARAGSSVLLRYANLGPIDRTMGVLGLQQRIVGRNASPAAHTATVVAPYLAPGQTIDAIADVPVGAAPKQAFAIADQSKRLHTTGVTGTSGALTFLSVWAYDRGAVDQPVVRNLALRGGVIAGTDDVVDGSEAMTFTFDEVPGAQHALFVDTIGATPLATTTAGTPGYVIDATGGTIDPSGLSAANLANGAHVLWVRSSTDGLSWGAPVGLPFFIDRLGPAMQDTTVWPTALNTTTQTALTLSTTGNTALTGTFNVNAGEWYGPFAAGQAPACDALPTSSAHALDADPDPVLPVEGVSQVQAFTAPVTSAGLTEGRYDLVTRARDASPAGQWSHTCGTVSFDVDTTGPTLSSSTPATIDGTQPTPGNPAWQDSVYTEATVTDPVSHGVASGVARIEGFLVDSHGAPLPNTTLTAGDGFEFVPKDGVWDSATETGYVLIPLSSIRTLPAGDYTVMVHGLDNAGNWGPLAAGSTISYRPTTGAPGIAVDSVAQAFSANGQQTVTVNGLATGQLLQSVAPATLVNGSALPGSGAEFTTTFTGAANALTATMAVTATDSSARSTTFTMPVASVTNLVRSNNRLTANVTVPPGATVSCASSTSNVTPAPGQYQNGANGQCRVNVNGSTQRYLWVRITDPASGLTLQLVTLTKA